MIIERACQWRPLAFSGDLLTARVTLNDGQLYLEDRAIVVNTNTAVANVHGWRRERIAPMSSVWLRDVAIDAPANLLLLTPSAGLRPEDMAREPGWTRFHHEGRPIDLWRSPSDVIGEVWLDVGALHETPDGDAPASARWKRFRVAVNLWFAPARTHCLIHREHAFIEIHSQIAGVGHMQKFRSQDYASLYEDIALAPGATTERPFCVVNDEDVPVYPWHQYFAESDCIWLAIEYHALVERNEHA
ncbi:hypothetical protein [Burkholderia perseverans]|uniref:hypothetical protein n=1 Tax=Burkholderia perseverans TaxID=2615214 RepID=UPI001FED38FB|nr:hypothetical protein [Burkholderia perseverans]